MNEFLWGSATASYQCEGAWNVDGKGDSIWDTYFHEMATDKENGDTACDFYHHFEEDIKMLKESNQNTFRFSLSWPRIFPKEKEINKEGVAFYHQVLHVLNQYDIEPNVTLYHWDLPDYLQQKGGWLNKETAVAFADFAEFCFQEFGSEIRLWATLNEPYYSLQCMYGSGNYPPNQINGQNFIIAAYHHMYASALAVINFRKHKDIGKIGIVADIHPCYGVDDSQACKRSVQLADQLYNGWVLDPAVLGTFPRELITELSKQYDMSVIKKEDENIFQKGTVDFLGLNYYNRSYIRPYTEGPSMVVHNNVGKRDSSKSNDVKKIMVVKNMFERIEDPKGEFTEWDFEIYPKGIYDACLDVTSKYGNIPIYITENGIGLHETLINDTVEDDHRIEFIKKHIDYLLQAKDAGADIRGYYIWSTMDLYSWINGTEKRYGLVYVDFKTMKRYPKKSYYWYRDFIKAYQSN